MGFGSCLLHDGGRINRGQRRKGTQHLVISAGVVLLEQTSVALGDLGHADSILRGF